MTECASRPGASLRVGAPVLRIMGSLAVAALVLCAGCALTPHSRSAQSEPPVLDQTFAIADSALQAGQGRAAERLYRDLLRIEPGHVKAQVGLGLALQVQERNLEAYDLFLNLAERRKDDAAEHTRLLLLAGRAALDAGDCARARPVFTRVIDTDFKGEDAGWGYNALALCAAREDALERALLHAKAARERLPANQGVAANQVRLLVLAGRRQDAEALVARAPAGPWPLLTLELFETLFASDSGLPDSSVQ